MKRRSLVFVTLATIIAIALLGNINPLLKKGIEKGGSQILQTTVMLEKADVSFFTGRGELKGLTVLNPEGFKPGPALILGRLKVRLKGRSLLTDNIHIKELHIQNPHVFFQGEGLSRNNLRTLLSSSKKAADPARMAENDAQKEKEAGQKTDRNIRIDKLVIEGTMVSIAIPQLHGGKLTLQLPDLELMDLGKNSQRTAAGIMTEVLEEINLRIIRQLGRQINNKNIRILEKILGR